MHHDVIRPTLPGDVPQLVEMTHKTAVFRPVEVVALEEVLADYLKQPGVDYHCYSFERDGQVIGFECHGPNTMTDRTWDLYWIVVNKEIHARGIGSQLLRFAEDDIKKHKGRILLIETSSMPAYEATRRFYKKHGYDQAALIKDYYADSDSLVVFRKRLEGDEPRGHHS
jgi:ribosomal protein S18 acetylase RimI-like enzyme